MEIIIKIIVIVLLVFIGSTARFYSRSKRIVYDICYKYQKKIGEASHGICDGFVYLDDCKTCPYKNHES